MYVVHDVYKREQVLSLCNVWNELENTVEEAQQFTKVYVVAQFELKLKIPQYVIYANKTRSV